MPIIEGIREAVLIQRISDMVREISKVGKEMLMFQERLAMEYKYKPIPINLFTGNIRDKYIEHLPIWTCVDGNPTQKLYSAYGTPISSGYKRIVIGDYGAFIEIEKAQMELQNIQCEVRQEYRINDEKYSKNIKYFWMTAKDNSHCKIYLQQKEVSYADYKVGMYYISPYEVFTDVI